jgi:hypothetical protein
VSYYDKDGSPITLDQWSAKYRDAYNRIALTEIPGKCKVSTVWLGLDHSHDGSTPLIFETMVFPLGDSFTEEDCDRYSTLAEAEAGHAAMVEKWSAK